jgi:hypothetical protein
MLQYQPCMVVHVWRHAAGHTRVSFPCDRAVQQDNQHVVAGPLAGRVLNV